MCASVDTTDDEVNSRLMLNHRVDECIHKRAVIFFYPSPSHTDLHFSFVAG